MIDDRKYHVLAELIKHLRALKSTTSETQEQSIIKQVQSILSDSIDRDHVLDCLHEVAHYRGLTENLARLKGATPEDIDDLEVQLKSSPDKFGRVAMATLMMHIAFVHALQGRTDDATDKDDVPEQEDEQIVRHWKFTVK
jgi:hypothetical protein